MYLFGNSWIRRGNSLILKEIEVGEKVVFGHLQEVQRIQQVQVGQTLHARPKQDTKHRRIRQGSVGERVLHVVSHCHCCRWG